MGPARQPLFRGTAPALVTPFTPDGRAIDEAAFRALIDFQVDGSSWGGEAYDGVEALVVLGTTGENPTVTDGERRRLVDLTLEHTAGRVPVIVGTGTNSTAETVTFSREAAEAGARVIVISHLGRPKGAPEERYSLAPVAARLGELLGHPAGALGLPLRGGGVTGVGGVEPDEGADEVDDFVAGCRPTRNWTTHSSLSYH